MARYCRYCGKPISDNAKFCGSCGRQLDVPEKASGGQTGQTQSPGSRSGQTQISGGQAGRPIRYSSPAAVHRSSQRNSVQGSPAGGSKETKSGPRRKPWAKALSLLLAAAILFTGFKYPGFFLKDKRPGKDSTVSTDDTLPGGKPSTGGNDSEAGIFTVPSVSDISVLFTDAERQNAPVHEAELSLSELRVSCGSLEADFVDSWNISGGDRLIVRDLPVKEDPATGYELHGYDISLASGQNTFATDVKLTIPRTAEDEYDGFCATYNEETGQYERLCYEISEDGKNYIIYTDHFSDKFEIKYGKTALDKIKKLAENGEKVDKKTQDYLSGIFYYPCNDRAITNPFNMNIAPDLYRIWSSNTNEYTLSLQTLADIVKQVPSDQLGYRLPMSAKIYGANDDMGGLMSLESGIKSGTEVAGGGKISILPDMIGKPLGALNAIIAMSGTLDKVGFEIANGKSTLDASANNWLGLVGGSIAIISVGTFGAPVTLALAAAGGICYLTSVSLQSSSPREIYTEEQNYREYYTSGTFTRNFRYDMTLGEDAIANGVDSIRRLSSLNDEENAVLRKLINEKLISLPGVSPLGGSNPAPIPGEWAMVIRQLYEFCDEKPDRISEVITEFYTNYARCFSYHDGIQDNRYFEIVQKIMEDRGDTRPAIVPAHDVQDQYVANMVHDLTAWTMNLHKELINTYQNKGKVEMALLIEKELLPLLNTKIEFTLEDTGVKDGGKLTDSIYNKPYKTDPGAKLEGHTSMYSTDTFADMRKAEVPMRFLEKAGGGYAPIEWPMFYPKCFHGSGDVGFLLQARETHFYPYLDNFLPKINESNNRIFSCTLYHYLMMGSPAAVLFHDMDGKIPDQTMPFKLSAPDQDGVIRVPIKVNGEAPPDEKVYTLRIEEDYAIDTFYGVPDSAYPMDVVIRVQGDKVIAEIPEVNIFTAASENNRRTSKSIEMFGASAKDPNALGTGNEYVDVLTDEYSLTRSGMTLTGTVTDRQEYRDGRFDLYGTVTIPPVTGTATEYYTLDQGLGTQTEAAKREYTGGEGSFHLYYMGSDRISFGLTCTCSCTYTAEEHGRMEFVIDKYDFFSGSREIHFEPAAEPDKVNKETKENVWWSAEFVNYDDD